MKKYECLCLVFVYFDFSLNSKVLKVALKKHVTSDQQILAGAQITEWITSLQHKQGCLAITQ